MADRKTMTKAEVAAYLDISTDTLDRLVADGVFPDRFMVGGNARWHKKDADAYLHLLSRMGREEKNQKVSKKSDTPPSGG